MHYGAFNLLSVLFGLLSWGISLIALMKRRNAFNICIIIFISMIFCCFSLFMQLIVICNNIEFQEWSTLLTLTMFLLLVAVY